MDSNSDEQTELLRNIWNQMKDLDRSLRHEIKESSERLGDRITSEVASVKQELGGRIDRVAEELVATKQELGGRIDRVAGEVAGLKVEMRDVKGEISELRNDVHQTNLDMRAVKVATQLTVDLLVKIDARQASDLADVRERVARIEQHFGFPR